jgi:drug/metabolite transporter (DMT)-like permease
MGNIVSRTGSEKQGIVYALAGMLAFSLFDSGIKHTLQQLPFAQVIFVTYIFNILITGGIGLSQRKSFRPRHGRHVAVIVTMNVFEQLCFLTGLKYLPFAELFVVILATPMLVLVFSAIFLREHLHRNQVIAMTLGFLGALGVAASPLLGHGAAAGDMVIAPNAAWIGWLCAIGNTFFGAGRTCYTRKFAQDENPFSLMMFFFIALLLISGLQLPTMGWSIKPLALLPLAVASVIGNMGYLLYLRSFKTTRAPLIAATQYSQIIWALLLGFFLFHETPTLVGLAGSLLILISGYVLYLRKHPPTQDEALVSPNDSLPGKPS